MSDLDDFRITYFEECAELLLDLEEQFAAISAGDHSNERLNAVFRAVHSIKGGGGAFGFTRLVAFAHAFETLLDQLRDGRVALDAEILKLCLRGNDVIADFVGAAQLGADPRPGHGDAEIAKFKAAVDDAVSRPVETQELDLDFVPVIGTDSPADEFASTPLTIERAQWEIRFAPHSELYARANEPLLLLRELANFGDVSVSARLGELPPLAEFEPFGAYCSWDVTLVSSTATEASLAEVFEFVEGICDLTIVQLGTDREQAEKPKPVVGPGLAQLAAIVTPPSVRKTLDQMPAEGFAELAEVFAEPKPIAPGVVPIADAGAAETERRVGEPERRSTVQSIRVDLDKVDRVVNMVGELVITQSMLAQQMDDMLKARYPELVRGLEVLAQTTRGLQDSVMAIRAQPVKSVFSRMPRLVRELAEATGKTLKLETFGDTTEIDKTVIEQLVDPLTHMIRNAADHGIETPDARIAAGKPAVGTITLSAEQSGSSILITVEDDGAGIDRARVLQVARARGVAAATGELTNEQIDNLIFAAGFSTATQVTNLSGRGVGMDVVLSNVKKIGGSVQVRSVPGQGTRMTLRLPLTLAVLDVMLVKVAGAPYVVPLAAIVETQQCARADFSLTPSGSRLLRLRGEYVQVLDLAERLGLRFEGDLNNRFIVLCEAEGGVKVALIVEDIVGQQQVVIKSLEENFEHVEGIAGGTILGDGNVALIIDVEGLRTAQPHRDAA